MDVMDLFRETFAGCLKFLNWHWHITPDFDFSLWQVGMFCWMFITSFNFICRLFGHEPIDGAEKSAQWYDEGHEDGYRQWNFRREYRKHGKR